MNMFGKISLCSSLARNDGGSCAGTSGHSRTRGWMRQQSLVGAGVARCVEVGKESIHDRGALMLL